MVDSSYVSPGTLKPIDFIRRNCFAVLHKRGWSSRKLAEKLHRQPCEVRDMLSTEDWRTINWRPIARALRIPHAVVKSEDISEFLEKIKSPRPPKPPAPRQINAQLPLEP